MPGLNRIIKYMIWRNKIYVSGKAERKLCDPIQEENPMSLLLGSCHY